MSGREPRRVLLVGGAGGPSGWELDKGVGSPSVVTLDDLCDIERHLMEAGERLAAQDLAEQRVRLVLIANEWQRRVELREAGR